MPCVNCPACARITAEHRRERFSSKITLVRGERVEVVRLHAPFPLSLAKHHSGVAQPKSLLTHQHTKPPRYCLESAKGGYDSSMSQTTYCLVLTYRVPVSASALSLCASWCVCQVPGSSVLPQALTQLLSFSFS